MHINACQLIKRRREYQGGIYRAEQRKNLQVVLRQRSAYRGVAGLHRTGKQITDYIECIITI